MPASFTNGLTTNLRQRKIMKLPIFLKAAIMAAVTPVLSSHGATINLNSETDPSPPLLSTEDTEYILNADIQYELSSFVEDTVFGGTSSIAFTSFVGSYFDLSFLMEDSPGANGIAAEGSLTFSKLGDMTFSGFEEDNGWDPDSVLSATGNSQFTLPGDYEDNFRISISDIHGTISFTANNMTLLRSTVQIEASLEDSASSGLSSKNASGVNLERIQGDIVFQNNIHGYDGAILSSVEYYSDNPSDQTINSTIRTGITFSDISGNILFENNGDIDNSGAVITSYGNINVWANNLMDGESSVSFRDISGSVAFKGNLSSNFSAAISDRLTFEAVSSDLEKGNVSWNAGVTFDNIGNGVVFQNNKSNYNDGGAISAHNQTRFYLANDAVSGVEIETCSGVVFQNIRGGVQFSGNTSGSNGGAIATYTEADLNSFANATESITTARNTISFTDIEGDLLFEKNEAVRGGAIFIFAKAFASTQTHQDEEVVAGLDKALAISGLSIKNITGNVLFENNIASEYGGAIYMESFGGDTPPIPTNTLSAIAPYSTPAPGEARESLGSVENSLFLSADGGNIIFQGNRVGLSAADYVANSICLTEGAYIDQLRAAEGRTINFHDPVLSYTFSDEFLHFNQTENGTEYTGTILFSGEKVGEYIIKDDFETDAAYQKRLYESRYSRIMQDAILHNGVLHVADEATLELHSLTVNHSELKTSNGGLLKAKMLTLNGALIDIKGLLSGSAPLALETRLLSGQITAWDRDGDLYSGTGPLTKDRTFAVLTIGNDDANLDGFSLDMSDDRTGDTKYGVQGEWSLTWDDQLSPLAADNPAHTLYAHWTYTGYNIDPEKQQDAMATINSLWTSKSNLDTLTNTVRGQMGSYRFMQAKDTNFWTSGLGDFSSQRSTAAIDGYDYWGGGYALGADTRICKNIILGLSFGQLIGTHQGRSKHTSIDQDTLMEMVYASYLQQIDNRNSLRYEASIGYGSTSNRMSSYDNRGEYARGKWDNMTGNITFRLNWDYSLDRNWVLTPFIGLEYSHGRQDAFTESGRDARIFDKSKLYNLTLPIGTELTHVSNLSGGRVWINKIGLSYTPDVYRHNPGGRGQFVGDTEAWKTYCINPPRNSGTLDVSTRYHFNDSWAVFAAYQLDVRDRGCYQNVNVGISTSF